VREREERRRGEREGEEGEREKMSFSRIYFVDIFHVLI
jgi:hypothetical protein